MEIERGIWRAVARSVESSGANPSISTILHAVVTGLRRYATRSAHPNFASVRTFNLHDVLARAVLGLETDSRFDIWAESDNKSTSLAIESPLDIR